MKNLIINKRDLKRLITLLKDSKDRLEEDLRKYNKEDDVTRIVREEIEKDLQLRLYLQHKLEEKDN